MINYGCIFCRIANKEGVTATFVEETAEVFVIDDIAPRKKTHLLIIPKNHFRNMKDVDANDNATLCQDMFRIVVNLAKRLKHRQSFKLLCNNEYEAGQEIMHLHWHFLSDETLSRPELLDSEAEQKD
jgi:histidine triad (HIT) family protein